MQVYLIIAHIRVKHLRLLKLKVHSWKAVLGFHVDSSSYSTTIL